MVAQVAEVDPETAAKMPQPTTLTCMRRPGSRVSQGARPWNMSSESRVRKRISAIQMKRGSAVSAQFPLAPHMVVAITVPAGAEVNSTRPASPTPRSARATHRPAVRRTAITTRSTRLTSVGSTRPQPSRVMDTDVRSAAARS
jgi:hypothetical protein